MRAPAYTRLTRYPLYTSVGGRRQTGQAVRLWQRAARAVRRRCAQGRDRQRQHALLCPRNFQPHRSGLTEQSRGGRSPHHARHSHTGLQNRVGANLNRIHNQGGRLQRRCDPVGDAHRPTAVRRRDQQRSHDHQDPQRYKRAGRTGQACTMGHLLTPLLPLCNCCRRLLSMPVEMLDGGAGPSRVCPASGHTGRYRCRSTADRR